ARVVVSRFAKLAVATVAATLLLIGLGGLVRATDSGLGCPDWPGCYGKVLPPPGDAHAWIEHIHRYWAGVVVLLLVWLALEARRSGQPIAVRRVTLFGLIPIVAMQALLGALVVWIKLHWVSVSSHLALALSILGLATWVAVDALRREGRLRAGGEGSPSLQTFTAVTAGLVFVQMILGSLVTGFNAGMAYETFPSFNNRAVPQFTKGFVWPQSLHVGHRLVAFVLLAGVLAFVLRSRRPDVATVVRRAALLALALVVVQIILGVLNLRYELSAWTVVPHLVVGASLWVTMLVAAFCSRASLPAVVDIDETRAIVSTP
ncbi:MAG: COX15/CtaA family protein, partial [Mycobacteriales bacterium]